MAGIVGPLQSNGGARSAGAAAAGGMMADAAADASCATGAARRSRMLALLPRAQPRRRAGAAWIAILTGLTTLRTEFTQTVTDAHGSADRGGQRQPAGAAAGQVSLGLPPRPASGAPGRLARRCDRAAGSCWWPMARISGSTTGSSRR